MSLGGSLIRRIGLVDKCLFRVRIVFGSAEYLGLEDVGLGGCRARNDRRALLHDLLALLFGANGLVAGPGAKRAIVVSLSLIALVITARSSGRLGD